MEVGIGFPNTFDIDRTDCLKWARKAEEGPFTSLSFLDRLGYVGTEPLSTLATCAGVTDDIRLATTIVAAPLRNAALLAKETASIDVLCDGRLVIGLAIGAREEDYEIAGVSWSDRGRRFTQQLARLRECWEDDSLGPDPVQEGGPTVLIGGESNPTYKRVGRFADGYVHGGGPPKVFTREAERARAAWAEMDRAGDPELWGQGYFCLGDEEVVKRGREYLLDYYAFTGPFAEDIADGMLTTPQDIVKFLRGYDDAGCDEMVLLPAVAEPEQVDRLDEVLEREWL